MTWPAHLHTANPSLTRDPRPPTRAHTHKNTIHADTRCPAPHLLMLTSLRYPDSSTLTSHVHQDTLPLALTPSPRHVTTHPHPDTLPLTLTHTLSLTLTPTRCPSPSHSHPCLLARGLVVRVAEVRPNRQMHARTERVTIQKRAGYKCE